MNDAPQDRNTDPPGKSTQNGSGAPLGYGKAEVDSLTFDYRNPRLAEYGFGPKTPEEEILKALWKLMAVDEVAMSIASSGYWDDEPLFVTKEDGEEVVLEGKRRLAALKILRSAGLSEKLKATDLPKVSSEALKKLD